ncbi:MAG: FHA domain-containing protein [Deltaproteobacteria bacterium]|nr:FHA domain-containing protein [Deltaproteobacteria bacterium]
MPFLWVVAQGQKVEEGRRVELSRDPFSIGRGPDNELTIEDEQISRHHAKILRTARGWVLTDNGSANGLWVDETRVDNVRLRDGVRVRIGHAAVTFHDLRDKATVVAGDGGKARAPAAGAAPDPAPSRKPAPSAPNLNAAPSAPPLAPAAAAQPVSQTPSAPHLPAVHGTPPVSLAFPAPPVPVPVTPQTPSAPHLPVVPAHSPVSLAFPAPAVPVPAMPQTPSAPHLPAIPAVPAGPLAAPAPAMPLPSPVPAMPQAPLCASASLRENPPAPRPASAPRRGVSTGVVAAIVVASLIIVASGAVLIWRLSTGGSSPDAPAAEPTRLVAATGTATAPPAAAPLAVTATTAAPASKVANSAPATDPAPPAPVTNGTEFLPDPALGFAGVREGRRQRIDGAAGGWVGLPNGARLDAPASAVDATLDLALIRTAAPAAIPGLAGAVIGDAYYAVTDRPGRRTGAVTLSLPYDPAALPAGTKESGLGAVAIFDGRFAWPVSARVDPEKHVVVIERPELGVLDPAAVAGLARLPAGAEPRPPAAPPRLGHLVVATDLLGLETHRVGPCDRALPGEAHSIAGHAFRILVAAQTTCAFVEQVSGILHEALGIYQREFPLADGSPPFDEWSASVASPMPVVLDAMTADVPGAVYDPLGWGGSITVEAVAAVSDAERSTYERELRVTIFHELFHGVQDMHRNMFAAFWGGRMWWYEATAEWAGRKFSLRASDATTPFDDMVDAAVKPGHGTPYVLAVPIDESRSWHGGRASYHYAMLVEHVEEQTPGSIRRTLQEGLTGSDDLLKRLYGDGRIAETYPDFVVRFWARGNGGVWTGFKLMETGLETREWRPAGAEPGAALGEPVPLRTKEERYPDDGRSITMSLAPATARFFWLHATSPVNPNLSLSVYVEGGGQPVDHGLLIRPAEEGPPSVQRLEPKYVVVTGFGTEFAELWVVVFRPYVPGEDRAAREYRLHVGLRPDCGNIPPTCIGRGCRPTPEQRRWEECQAENERWLGAEANAGRSPP